jgi:hypothetical protein
MQRGLLDTWSSDPAIYSDKSNTTTGSGDESLTEQSAGRGHQLLGSKRCPPGRQPGGFFSLDFSISRPFRAQRFPVYSRQCNPACSSYAARRRRGVWLLHRGMRCACAIAGRSPLSDDQTRSYGHGSTGTRQRAQEQVRSRGMRVSHRAVRSFFLTARFAFAEIGAPWTSVRRRSVGTRNDARETSTAALRLTASHRVSRRAASGGE